MGDLGKIEAFGGAHGEATIADEPNFFVGLRKPWTNMVRPPPPAQVVGSRIAVPQRILDAGFHEGSTYFELEAFASAVDARAAGRPGGEALVTALDGLLAVAVGAAAHRSIEVGRPVLISEMLPQDERSKM